MKDLIGRELEEVAKETLNFHSFIYKELLKNEENTVELKCHPILEMMCNPLLNNVNSILGNCVYHDTDSAKERN